MPALGAKKREVTVAVDEVPAAKRAKAVEKPKPKDPVEQNTLLLHAALENMEFEIPGTTNNRHMLLGVLPILATPREARNSYQQMMAGMFAEVFEKEESRLQQRVDVVQVKTDADNEEIAACETVIENAKTEKQAKKEEIRGKKDEFDEAEVVFDDARAELKATMDGRIQIEARAQALAQEKETFLEVQRNSFEALRDGLLEGREVKQHIGKLKEFFQSIGVDNSLIMAYPSALSKKPEERGDFDAMVLQQLEEFVVNALTELEAKLAAATEEDAEQAGLVAASEAIVEVAKEKMTVRSDAVTATEEQLAGLETALKDARAAAKERKKKASGNANEHKQEQGLLEQYQHGVLAAFRFLQERSEEKQAEEKPADEPAI